MTQPTLIICGSIAIDRIMNFSGRYKDLIHPEKLHVLSLSILLDKLEETPGGTAANIALNMAALGDHPVLLGAVGPDAESYVQRLSSMGVMTDFVHVSNLKTASFNVITDIENNQIGGFYPGAMGDAKNLSLKGWANQEAVVVVAAHDPESMRTQVAESAQYGLHLVYDPGQQVTNVPGEDLSAGIAAAEVLILNDYELGVLCKKIDTTQEYIKIKTPLVITTFGKDGSMIEGARAQTPIRIAAAQPAAVVDPTGAGDAYRAGFLYGYLRQWDLQKCGQLGSVIASFVVEKHGTQVELSSQAITDRYRATFNQEIEL